MNIEDEYFKSQLDKFSVERKRFVEDTAQDDISMVILRAHMYVEKEMVELTNRFFKYPNKFGDRYSFANRLDLLYALGVIDKELYDPIKKINEIRNDISHKLEYKYTENEYEKLYRSLSKDILHEYRKDLDLARELSGKSGYI